MKPPSLAPIFGVIYPGLCDVARARGYALAIHGTLADQLGRRMRPYSAVRISQDELDQDRGMVLYFIREIRQAAMERRPMPLQESEDMSPSERDTFRRRLQEAMLEAGVVIVEAAPATQDSRGRTPSAARPRATRG